MLDRAIEKSMDMQAAEAKYGSPGNSKIKVRRDGIFGKKMNGTLPGLRRRKRTGIG
jgi:hypothetical protein